MGSASQDSGPGEMLSKAHDPRSARHAAHEALAHWQDGDPEPIGGQSTGKHPETRSRPNHPRGRLELTSRGSEKVWKDKFWKRRSKARAEKAAWRPDTD